MATNSTYDYSQRSAFWNVPTQRKASAETQNASAAEIIPGKRKTGLIAKSRLDQRSPKAKKKVGSHRKKDSFCTRATCRFLSSTKDRRFDRLT